MTTGTKLKSPYRPSLMTLAKLLFNATAWMVFGSYIGWYVGQAGGFHRGVTLTAELFISMMDMRDANANGPPRKFTDL